MTRSKTAYQRGVETGYTQGYDDGCDYMRGEPRAITDDMVERAAQAAWEHMSLFPRAQPLPPLDSASRNAVGAGMRYRRAQRAALEAALNPKEAPGA